MPAQAGEKLLKIAIFSDALQIQPKHGSTQTLVERRRILARTLRETRRRGVVPVFVSLGWFLFSLALSIQNAFELMGDNQTAHDLALGLLLAWFPVFLLATIVDRNPVGADRIRRKLNNFLEVVRLALLDSASRRAFLADSNRKEVDISWTTALEIDNFYRDGFFTRFAGQGRVRWHYGVAHPILAGMETNHLAAHGRNWLRDSETARQTIIWGPTQHQGLISFDLRMVWQIVSAFTVVGCTVFGAFILSCVQYYWGFGMGLSVTIMVGAIAYITYQYFTQSHLSSEDYAQAMQGLRTTRWFKRRTIWTRYVLEANIRMFKRIFHRLFGTKVESVRRSLVWTPKVKESTPSTVEASDESLPQQPSPASKPASVEHTETSSVNDRRFQSSSSGDD
ncbi:MAG: hypothetical protein Q9188_002254 [Gyalolechia gomerana]